ncbi:MAG: response regulator [Elusimicrobia bacterium]|nr:response regulator [Elusimicrobiota bacterium]
MEYKILVVDDEEEIREMLSVELGRQGYTVKTAVSGNDCLEKIQQEKFDLVFLDLKMPKLDGIATLEKIKNIDSDIDVIIITAYASVATGLESIKKGAYDYISKPFNFEELRSRVKECFEKKRLALEENRMRILVIDSDRKTVDTLNDVLVKENFIVYSVNEGNTGIKKAKELLPDMVITDVMLPGISGWDVCETLKKDEKTKDIPIVILTGMMIKTRDEIKSFELGVDDFIIKPFDSTALVKRIKKILYKSNEIKILKDETSLFKVAEAISSLMKLDELLQLILKLAVDISKSDGGSILLYDAKTKEFEIKTTYGNFKESIVGQRTKLGERIVGAAAEEGKPIIIHGSLKNNPRFRQLKEYNGVASGMVIPMMVKEKLIGCITLKRTKQERRFSQHESNLLSIFASQSALSIENAFLHEQLKKHVKELESRSKK